MPVLNECIWHSVYRLHNYSSFGPNRDFTHPDCPRDNRRHPAAYIECEGVVFAAAAAP